MNTEETDPLDNEELPEGEQPQQKTRNKGEAVRLNKRVKIFPANPLPELNMGNIKAYSAEGPEKKGNECIAYVCDPALMPRTQSAADYTNIKGISLLPLVEHGTVNWPVTKEEHYVFVYRNIIKKPLSTEEPDLAFDWSAEKTLNKVIRPIGEMLEDCRTKNFIHGGIRVENLFRSAGDDEKSPLILGDGLTAPHHYHQPALYIPIYRSMAQPVGRGAGTSADDLYALGVVLAVLMRSTDPMDGLSDREIIKRKIEHGSYVALTERDRFTGEMLELLRGLLHDDHLQRWTADELMMWLDGRRLTPKQAPKIPKAARALGVNGVKYFYAPVLAMDMPDHKREILNMFEDDRLRQWLERSLEATETCDSLETLQERAVSLKNKGDLYEDLMISNISMIIDPRAPLRYKGLAVTAHGFGAAFAQAYIQKTDIAPFAETIKHGLMSQWLGEQKKMGDFVVSITTTYDSCNQYLSQSRIGFGIERCLYALCNELYCLSDNLKGRCVHTPEELMSTFEILCEDGKTPDNFFDRHTAAFLSVRDGKSIDPFLFDLASPEAHKKIMAELRCIARMQMLLKLDSFPAIGNAFVNKLEPVYERFHDRSTREKLAKKVEAHAKAGSLMKMVNVLDNPELKKKDQYEFRKSMKEYRRLYQEAAELDEKLKNQKAYEFETAQKIAATTACLIAMFIGIFMFFISLTNEALF